MTRIALVYGLALAVGAFALRWLEYRYTVRIFSPEIHIALVALGFAGLGAWAGNDRPRPIALLSAAILRNPKVLPATA